MYEASSALRVSTTSLERSVRMAKEYASWPPMVVVRKVRQIVNFSWTTDALTRTFSLSNLPRSCPVSGSVTSPGSSDRTLKVMPLTTPELEPMLMASSLSLIMPATFPSRRGVPSFGFSDMRNLLVGTYRPDVGQDADLALLGDKTLEKWVDTFLGN